MVYSFFLIFFKEIELVEDNFLKDRNGARQLTALLILLVVAYMWRIVCSAFRYMKHVQKLPKGPAPIFVMNPCEVVAKQPEIGDTQKI